MLRIEIVRVDVPAKKTTMMTDYVAEQKPLCIVVNKTHYATIFCSPSDLKELAAGHLLSEGIIRSVEEIEEISFKKGGACNVKIKPNIDLKKRPKRSKPFSSVILSACDSPSPYQPSTRFPKTKSKMKVKAENFIAETFRKTGGVHAAAIYKSNGNPVASVEDVGRHNAVNKVISIGVLDKTDFSECFRALTERLTGDLALKAAMVKLPIVASLAAPIDSGIGVAKDVGLTLIGLALGRRMNIYNFPERILS